MTGLLCALLLAASEGEKPGLLVLDLEASGVEGSVAVALTEAIGAEVARRGIFTPSSSRDIASLLGVERQKQLLGCSENSSSCLAEVAGALGARFVLRGSITKIGSAFQLNLQMLDSNRAQPLSRAIKLASDLDALRNELPYTVAEATGTPLPPPPSRVLPISLIGVGAAAVIAGASVGVVALITQQATDAELKLGSTPGGTLRTLDSYRQTQSTITLYTVVSLVSLGVGAALLATGIALLPSAATPAGSVKVALVPQGAGVGLVGVFP